MTNDKLKIEYSYSRILPIGILSSILFLFILQNHLEFYGYALGLIILVFLYFDSKDLIIEKDKLTYVYYLRDIPFLKPKTITFSSQKVEITIYRVPKSGWHLKLSERGGKKDRSILGFNPHVMAYVDSDISIDNLITKLKEFGFSVYSPHKDGRHFIIPNFDKILNQEINIYPFKKNNLIEKYLPNSGRIIKRLIIDDEPDWYLIKLNNKVVFMENNEEQIIIRTKNKFESIVKGNKIIIAFFIIPNLMNIEGINLNKDQLVFGGWAILE